MPIERIGGWRRNPTVYTYGYLWTVHSLYYWWRDYGKSLGIYGPIYQKSHLPLNDGVTDDRTWEAYLSPCYLNVIDPIDTAFGEGILLNVTHELYDVSCPVGFFNKVHHCLDRLLSGIGVRTLWLAAHNC